MDTDDRETYLPLQSVGQVSVKVVPDLAAYEHSMRMIGTEVTETITYEYDANNVIIKQTTTTEYRRVE